MNDKRYLDSVGLQELVDWILLQLRTIKANQDAITDLLYKTDGTPGSIQQIVEEILKGKDITDLLQDDSISLYGGSATDVMDNKLTLFGGSAVMVTTNNDMTMDGGSADELI